MFCLSPLHDPCLLSPPALDIIPHHSLYSTFMLSHVCVMHLCLNYILLVKENVCCLSFWVWWVVLTFLQILLKSSVETRHYLVLSLIFPNWQRKHWSMSSKNFNSAQEKHNIPVLFTLFLFLGYIIEEKSDVIGKLRRGFLWVLSLNKII